MTRQLIPFGPGLGVLVRLGTYWYPGRLIDCPGEGELAKQSYSLYTVRMWRGCKFDDEARGLLRGHLAKVAIDKIVDCLWQAWKQRRVIRVSR